MPMFAGTAPHYLLALLIIICVAVSSAEAPITSRDREDALTCRMLLWVSAPGVVQLAQVVTSAGSHTLDAMCLNGVVARKIEPGAEDAARTGRWIIFTYRMMLGLPHREALVARDRPETPTPVLVHDRPFEAVRLLDVPGADPRPITVCMVHVLVSAEGKVAKATITRSTGEPALDTACENTILAADFIPARRGGDAVPAATDIWLNFQLP